MRLAFVFVLSGLMLAGCASMVPPPHASIAPATSYRQSIDLAGRLSLRYQQGSKEEALHGSFSWNQTPAHTRISLLTPLGQTAAVIDITPEGARLQQGGDAPPRMAADADQLVADTLGWPLPVAGLRHWLQGFGIDDKGQPFTASPQHPEFTTEDGWKLRYATWEDGSPVRPKRIDLERWTAQAGNVAIRIVIDTWQ